MSKRTSASASNGSIKEPTVGEPRLPPQVEITLLIVYSCGQAEEASRG